MDLPLLQATLIIIPMVFIAVLVLYPQWAGFLIAIVVAGVLGIGIAFTPPILIIGVLVIAYFSIMVIGFVIYKVLEVEIKRHGKR